MRLRRQAVHWLAPLSFKMAQVYTHTRVRHRQLRLISKEHPGAVSLLLSREPVSGNRVSSIRISISELAWGAKAEIGCSGRQENGFQEVTKTFSGLDDKQTA